MIEEQVSLARARRRSPAAWIAALGAATALLIVFPPSARRGGEASAAAGYERIVNRIFVENEWLETPPPPTFDERDLNRDFPQEIRLSAEARKLPQVIEFVRNSYLARDIVQDAPPIWRVDNGQVIGLDPTAHVVALPSSPVRRWTGNLLFRESAPPVTTRKLSGDFGEIVLEPPDFSLGMSPPVLFNLLSPRRQVARGTQVRIQERSDPEKGYLVADLMLWGSTPVVTSIDEGQAYYHVSVDGLRLAPLTRRAVLPRGSIEITSRTNSRDRKRFDLVETVSTSPEISTFRPWSGQRERAEPTAEFGRAVELALDRVAASSAMRDDQASAPITLTVDGRMQTALDSTLESFAASNRAYIGDEYQIGVTVMDALTGDVLALGSEIRPAPESRRTDGRPPPLNINFRRLQVGSAAKPPIAAAILQWRPDLLGLAIHQPGEGSELGDFLGVRFREGNTLGDTNPGPCDFDCFIRTSNNRYAIALMLLANGRRDGSVVETPGMYSIAGQARNQRPLSIFETRYNGRAVFSRATGSVVGEYWRDNIRDLFDIDFEAPSPARPGGQTDERSETDRERCKRADGRRLGDDVFNMFMWRDLLNQFSRADPCAFYGAAPERENFRLDRQYHFQSGMLTVILGGGEARWTNITLAQSYARIVTGERVSARLHPRAGEGAETTRGAFGLDERVRRRLTHAMTLVTGSADGTARAFASHAVLGDVRAALSEQDAVLGVFSKTGTPQIETPYYNRESRALNLLIRLNLLQLRDGVLAIERGGRPLPVDAASAPAVIRTLASDRSARDAIRQAGSTISSVVARLVRENARTAEGRANRFQIENRNTLVRVSEPDDMRKNYGKVFVFVAARYPASAPTNSSGMADNGDARPQRAYVVAINIQSNVDDREGPGGTTHMRLGAEIFNNVLRTRLTAPLMSRSQ